MADKITTSNTNDNNGGSAQGKRARGLFPRLSLNKTLELAQAIFDLGEGEPVRKLTVFNKLGKSPESGPSRTLMAASNGGYGLTSGSINTDFMSLTDIGLEIISTKDTSRRQKTILGTLFENELFSAFIIRFSGKGLNDEIAVDFLKTNHKLSDPDAKAAFQVFKENLDDHGLIREYSGRKVVLSQEMALEETRKSIPVPNIPDIGASANEPFSQGSDSTAQVRYPPRMLSDKTTPQFHFNIQIHLPENATPEVYEAIFKSISTHLLGRGEEE